MDRPGGLLTYKPPAHSSLYAAPDPLRFVLRSPGLQATTRRFDPLPSHSSARWTGPGGRLKSGTQTEIQGVFSKQCVSSVFLHLEPSLKSSAVIKVVAQKCELKVVANCVGCCGLCVPSFDKGGSVVLTLLDLDASHEEYLKSGRRGGLVKRFPALLFLFAAVLWVSLPARAQTTDFS